MRYSILYIFFIFILINQSEAQVCVGEDGRITWELWRGLFDDEISELTAEHDFPNRPDITDKLYNAATPVNYDNLFGGRVRGFIKVPSQDSVTFNITGNDKTLFYLSTDSTKENLTLIASHPDYTSEEEHDKFPEQTSSKIFLDTAQYYYFELFYTDDGGGDHSKIWWKTNFLSNSDWNVITAAYLNDIGCEDYMCAEAGTPCDDGNANTTDDVEDGYCNCVGIPMTTNVCIGERGKIERFRYDSIAGSGLYDLYEDPDYPGMPTYSEVLPIFGHGTNGDDYQGNLVQAYLTVPVTGLYKFNITGDDNTILFISSDESPENKQAHQALVTGYTYMTQHDKYLWQSTSNLYLEAGKYYYVEVNHKQGGGSNHFQAFWQTPFSGSGVWKRIPSFYMYDYDCDIACIPAGTPCDDGDPFTNADEYDGNCECVGVPCSGPDCDSPLANYVPFEKCGLTDQLDNNPENNWLSCQVNDNPNQARDRGHWIQYDLGERYQLLTSQIWNYNVNGQVEKGFESVAIDYSEDGTTWNTLGSYNWPLATGDSNYSGFIGPDFSDTYARYVLISSLDDTLTCRGIGKVAFNAVKCPLQGTICDDLDPATINDQYNEYCECVGQNPLVNDCIEMNVNLGDSTLFSYVHSAVQEVSSISTVDQNSYVGFVAGKAIVLDIGFETQSNSNFIAVIDTCDQSSNREIPKESRRNTNNKPNQEISKDLEVIRIGETDQYVIRFYIDEPTKVDLYINDMVGNKMYHLISHDYRNKGFYQKRIRSKKLNNGTYQVQLITPLKSETKKMLVGVEEQPFEEFDK